MKRQIKELRRVLLSVENGQHVFYAREDPSGVYHATLLLQGGFVHEIIDARQTLAADEAAIIVSNAGLTSAGVDLLDQLRDEARLGKAQDWLESEGFDRDHLALCRAWLERDEAQRLEQGAVVKVFGDMR